MGERVVRSRRRPRIKLSVVKRLLLWAGVGLLALAAVFWLHEWRWSHAAQHASGVITEMEARQDDQGQVLYYPHFRFRLPDGQVMHSVGIAGAQDDFTPGQQVPVIYRAADPGRASIATTRQIFGLSIALAVIGTVIFDMGAVLWVILKRRAMRSARA